jgi:hypothetical protein
VEWPESFYEMRRGVNCFMCAEGRPEENPIGVRIFAGNASDAYLRRADIQRGYTISTWRGRHVAEPTETKRPSGPTSMLSARSSPDALWLGWKP